MQCKREETTSTRETREPAETVVEIQIVGTAALIQDEGASEGTPMMLVLPAVHEHEEGVPAHVPYLAWKGPQQGDIFRTHVEEKSSSPDDTIDPGTWRFVRLDRQELVIDSDLSGNEVLDIGNPPATCETPDDRTATDFRCLPRFRDLLPGQPRVNPEVLASNDPHPNVLARMKLLRGRMFAQVNDRCPWEFRIGSDVRKKTFIVGVIPHKFKIRGDELRLKSRMLGAPYTESNLVTLRANGSPRILLRIGNSPDVFPALDDMRRSNPDRHYTAYYGLLLTGDQRQIDTAGHALPWRLDEDELCDAGHRPTLTCGPGRT